MPSHVRGELFEAAHGKGAALHFPGPSVVSCLLGITTEAERRNGDDPGRRDESRRWVRASDDAGTPQAALGPQDWQESLPHAGLHRESARLPAAEPGFRTHTGQAPGRHAQMLVRLGYGPNGAPSPRLPVEKVLGDN